MHARLPNALSASRVVLALAVVFLSAELDAPRYVATIVAITLGLITDVLDGYLARRWKTASEVGYVLDSMGDRAIHLALVLVFLVRYGFHPVFAWLIIFRDIGIFAIRVLTKGWLPKSVALQWISRLHAVILRVWMGLFLVRDGFRVFAHHDVLGTFGFDLAQLILLCLAILASYYGLARSFGGLIERDHKNV